MSTTLDGAGKTRLLQELLSTVDGALVAGCPPVPEPYTLGPLVDAPRQATDRVAGLRLTALAGVLRPLEFLLYLARREVPRPGVVITYRPEDLPADSLLLSLSARLPNGAVRLGLAPLTLDETVALLTDDAIAISDGAGLPATLLRYDTAQRIAAVAQAGFRPTPAKRRLVGGTPAVHHAPVNRAPAILFVLGDQVVGRRDVRHRRRQDRNRARHRRPRPPRPPHRSLAAARTGHAAHHPVVTRRRLCAIP